MTINKAKLIDLTCKNLNFSKQEATSTVESFLEIIKKPLESREDLLISGFGKFIVKEKNKRRGRNPHTGNDLILDARRVVIFKCSRTLRENINNKKSEKTLKMITLMSTDRGKAGFESRLVRDFGYSLSLLLAPNPAWNIP